MIRVLKNFMADESGATAIEYALIASIVGLGIIGGLTQLPPALNAVFTSFSAWF